MEMDFEDEVEGRKKLDEQNEEIAQGAARY